MKSTNHMPNIHVTWSVAGSVHCKLYVARIEWLVWKPQTSVFSHKYSTNIFSSCYSHKPGDFNISKYYRIPKSYSTGSSCACMCEANTISLSEIFNHVGLYVLKVATEPRDEWRTFFCKQCLLGFSSTVNVTVSEDWRWNLANIVVFSGPWLLVVMTPGLRSDQRTQTTFDWTFVPFAVWKTTVHCDRLLMEPNEKSDRLL